MTADRWRKALEFSMQTVADYAKYTYKTYGVARTFKTEGDMYEAITGRRSKVLDHEPH